MVKTDIIATLGPSSTSESVVRKMIIAGLDIVRLNFSHGTPKEHIQRIQLVRRLNKKMRRATKIMQDLEGYRLRVGRLAKEVKLVKNAIVFLTQEPIIGRDKKIPFDYTGPLQVIKTGSFIYIDDGKIVLKVVARQKKCLKVRVVIGGTLSEKKGINIPDVKLVFEALTQKDRNDVQIAISYRLDYVAQSFVRDAGDIHILRDILAPGHPRCKIFAKVENKEALDNIDEIIDASDGIIVARGDLGICLPIYKGPIFQKEIIKKCLRKKKPVVVATQMLDSMTRERLPTRAEVSDVANAILDGANILLLSAETAIGKHPHLVVQMMNTIIKYTEAYKRTL